MGVDGLAGEPAKPAVIAAKTPASVNSHTRAEVPLELGETVDLVAVTTADVDDVDVALAEEALGGVELRIAGGHQRAPPRALAAPFPQRLAEAVTLVVSG